MNLKNYEVQWLEHGECSFHTSSYIYFQHILFIKFGGFGGLITITDKKLVYLVGEARKIWSNLVVTSDGSVKILRIKTTS